MPPSPYVNETKAAHYLGLAPKTLQTWRSTGKGPRSVKFHGAVRYAVADLEAFAAGAAVKS